MATTLGQNKVEITVKSRRTNALLDTGASITVASASFINKTSLARTSFLPATHPVIKGVAGARLTVLGVLTVPISIFSPCRYHTRSTLPFHSWARFLKQKQP